MNPIKVLIFDDNKDRRDSLSMLMEITEGFELVGTCANGMNAVKRVAETKPDIILMDIEMPGINGIAATASIKKEFPKINILIQTVFENPSKIFDSIAAGASGYILKSTTADKIIEAIREIQAGGSSLSPAVAAKILNFFRNPDAQLPAENDYNLSDRELEVLNQLVKGLSYKLIANNLSISYNTVNTHIRNVYEKLQVHSAGEAVAKAIQERLIG